LSNFHKIIRALDEIGVDTSGIKDIVFDPQKTFMRIPSLAVRVEFLPQIPGVSSFSDAKKSSTRTNIDGLDVHVLSLDDLIKNKSAVRRPSDLLDIEELQKRKNTK
jgi:hypothetical protein